MSRVGCSEPIWAQGDQAAFLGRYGTPRAGALTKTAEAEFGGTATRSRLRSAIELRPGQSRTIGTRRRRGPAGGGAAV